MAGRGPAPKSERSRPNDTARRQAEFTELSSDGLVRGPDLPASPPPIHYVTKDGDEITIEREWSEQTQAWWKTWRTSAMAQTFVQADWDFLIDTAVLHSALWQGETRVAGELRQRVVKFGSTPEDRLRLRISITVPEPDSSDDENPKQRRDRKQALLHLVEPSAEDA